MTAQRGHYLLMLFLGILAFWILSFYQGITTAIDVWYSSEIYNHCFLVLPCVAYFIYQNKKQLLTQPIAVNYWLLWPLIVLVCIQLFAQIGDVKLLMHIASFCALPLTIWFLLGNRVSQQIAFPLFFIVFAIPMGDQLIPFLQELTTDLAVPMLEITGVPIYRNGLYLEIPEGRFLVAEACSGISFLITSVAFGFIYSFVTFSTLKKRFYFILLALFVPVIANALRVYGIILTGHLTDMKHAVGADHLIYGGIFYCIILFILILIGERYKEASSNREVFREAALLTIKRNEKKQTARAFMVLVMVMGVQQFWFNYIETSAYKLVRWPVNQMHTGLAIKTQTEQHITPQLKNTTQVVEGRLISAAFTTSYNKVTATSFYGAYFDEISSELISGQHRFYDDQYWTLLNQSTVQIAGKHYNKLVLTTYEGQHRYLYYWYIIDGQSFISQTKAKLYQSYLKMMGKNSSGHLLMISSAANDDSESPNTIEKTLEQPEKVINTYYQQLNFTSQVQR